MLHEMKTPSAEKRLKSQKTFDSVSMSVFIVPALRRVTFSLRRNPVCGRGWSSVDLPAHISRARRRCGKKKSWMKAKVGRAERDRQLFPRRLRAAKRTTVSQTRSEWAPLSEIPSRQLVSLRQLAVHCWWGIFWRQLYKVIPVAEPRDSQSSTALETDRIWSPDCDQTTEQKWPIQKTSSMRRQNVERSSLRQRTQEHSVLWCGRATPLWKQIKPQETLQKVRIYHSLYILHVFWNVSYVQCAKQRKSPQK